MCLIFSVKTHEVTTQAFETLYGMHVTDCTNGINIMTLV